MHYIGLQGVPVEPTVAFKAQRTPTTGQTWKNCTVHG